LRLAATGWEVVKLRLSHAVGAPWWANESRTTAGRSSVRSLVNGRSMACCGGVGISRHVVVGVLVLLGGCCCLHVPEVAAGGPVNLEAGCMKAGGVKIGQSQRIRPFRSAGKACLICPEDQILVGNFHVRGS
jgi:hypothetical protein